MRSANQQHRLHLGCYTQLRRSRVLVFRWEPSTASAVGGGLRSLVRPKENSLAKRFAMKASRSPLLRVFAPILLAWVSHPSGAQDWPQLRGANLDSTAEWAPIASAFKLELDEVWRRPLGSGYSAVAVLNDVAVTAATVDQRDVVFAFSAQSGRELWQFDLSPAFLGRSGSDDGTSSTPTLGTGRAFVLHPSGRLVALSLSSGELEWERNLQNQFGAQLPGYGFSTQPLLVGDRLFLQAGGNDGRLLVALEASSGELIWTAGEDSVPVEHQNPMAWSGPGGDQIVVVSPSELASYRQSDGERLWRLALEGRGHAGDITVVDSGRILMHRYGEDSQMVVVEGTRQARATQHERRCSGRRTILIAPTRFRSCMGITSTVSTAASWSVSSSPAASWSGNRDRPAAASFHSSASTLFVVSNDGELVAVRSKLRPHSVHAKSALSTRSPGRWPTLARFLFVRGWRRRPRVLRSVATALARTITVPWPTANAVSTASPNRARIDGPAVSRSMTTSMSCRSCRSSDRSSPSWMISPSTRARTKPRFCKSSNRSRCSPFCCLTTGARTMNFDFAGSVWMRPMI